MDIFLKISSWLIVHIGIVDDDDHDEIFLWYVWPNKGVKPCYYMTFGLNTTKNEFVLEDGTIVPSAEEHA